jgi:hypothetical protein
MTKILLIISLTLLSTQLLAQDFILKLHGKVVEKISLSSMQSGKLALKHGLIEASTVKIFNVFRGYEKTYKGYDLFLLMDVVYGKDWQKNNKIIFNSIDGYHQISLVKKLLEATKNKIGVLAYTESDRLGFTEIIKDGKKIDPAPLYLVWTNFSNADKASHADTIKWPYQLIEINLE